MEHFFSIARWPCGATCDCDTWRISAGIRAVCHLTNFLLGGWDTRRFAFPALCQLAFSAEPVFVESLLLSVAVAGALFATLFARRIAMIWAVILLVDQHVTFDSVQGSLATFIVVFVVIVCVL